MMMLAGLEQSQSGLAFVEFYLGYFPPPHHLLSIVTSCHDPGDVEHSRRLISSPKFPVGATVQYICDQGFVLTGSAILTCHDRQASSPKWSDRAPKCLCKCQTGRKKPLVGDKRCCPWRLQAWHPHWALPALQWNNSSHAMASVPPRMVPAVLRSSYTQRGLLSTSHVPLATC